MTLADFIEANYENVRIGINGKITAVTDRGEVSMYACGTVIRIDIKPL